MAKHPMKPVQPLRLSPLRSCEVRVERRVLADGSIKEYTYARRSKDQVEVRSADSIASLIDSFQRSPKWNKLAPQTQTMYCIYLRDLHRAFGHVAAYKVKRADIMVARDAIAAKRGHGAATGFIRAASGVFTWALDMQWGNVHINPAANGSKDLEKGHLLAWTQEEADVALARLPEHLRRVVVLALYTGARRGDLCGMTWENYDGDSLHFVPQKTRRHTTELLSVPCHPALQAELSAWRGEAAATATILTDAQGKPWKGNLLSHYLPEALCRIGLTNELNVHGLRKLACANLADAGCSTHEIAAITGHRTLGMIQLYTETANRRKLGRSAIARLADLKSGAPVDNVLSIGPKR